jgi:hypothetical protein
MAMNNTVRLELIAQSYDRFFRTRDTEHLNDVERILEYDGLEDFEE